ncbi:hypothetical protein LWI29_008841 [Acer saccharum]|uniref:EF-hand domain-containing protein n=1 Tax=Acer saccharum TaxID=4024 RepID=A0AA39RWR5_ACESA|nr:hypothetical protein LWI29_008841 [Acer saccharum]KAK1559694.1 hypothetical protein Q3G72_017372 [Acer saccharum]
MARPDPSDSEHEQSESSSSEEEIEEPGSNGQKQEEISGYEKQRLSRIAENKARMEALGISKVASSLIGSSQNQKPSNKRKGKRKIDDDDDDDDEDFRPNDDNDDVDDVDDENDDELLADVASRSRKRKVKGKDKSPKPKKKAPVRKQLASSDHIDEEDDELMQALALSLQLSAEVSGPTLNERKTNAGSREDARKGKRKKSFTSRVQMTEDEVVLHFFQFDGSEKGGLSMTDIRRVATAHDFTWTDDELADMIRCFDSDRDGKLNLEDFRKIVSRCNMLRTSENP